MAPKTAIVWAVEGTADALNAQYRAEAAAEVHTRLHALSRLRLGEEPMGWRPLWGAAGMPFRTECLSGLDWGGVRSGLHPWQPVYAAAAAGDPAQDSAARHTQVAPRLRPP